MSDVICPGQQALFTNDGSPRYLRVTFFVCWAESPDNNFPGCMEFFLPEHGHPFRLTYDGKEALQREVLALLQKNCAPSIPVSAFYQGYEGMEMTAKNVSDVGWRMLT